MKQVIKNILLLFACGAILTGCGGSGNSSGSGLKKNPYLGSLPAIYANYNAEKKAHEAKIEEQGMKLMAGGEKNSAKIMKLMKEDEETSKAMKEKMTAAVNAEIAKVAGKEVPVKFSDALANSKELFYNVGETKLADNKGALALSLSFSVKNDLEVPRLKGYDYGVYFRIIAADGSTITKSVLLPVKLENKAFTLSAGEHLLDNLFPLSIANMAQRYADFAGIEFITKAEYNEIK